MPVVVIKHFRFNALQYCLLGAGGIGGLRLDLLQVLQGAAVIDLRVVLEPEDKGFDLLYRCLVFFSMCIHLVYQFQRGFRQSFFFQRGYFLPGVIIIKLGHYYFTAKGENNEYSDE